MIIVRIYFGAFNMEREEQVARNLLSRGNLMANAYLVYRLSPSLTLPISCLTAPRAVGRNLHLDPLLFHRALERIPFVKV
jgi:hypothetical protein